MIAEQLKKAVLQAAIQGKLTEQLPEDGDARDLLKQIQKEKSQLIKEGKLKKEKPLPAITDAEIPFDIPTNWVWVRLGSIFRIINGFTPLRSNYQFWKNKDIPWFTVEDIRDQGHIIESTKQYISKSAVNDNRIVPENSVLLCCTSASIGEYALTKIPLTTNQQFNGLAISELFREVIHPEYIYYFAQTLTDQLLKEAGKTTFPFLSTKKLANFTIPVPPFLEQLRIVRKIEEVILEIEKLTLDEAKLDALEKSFPKKIKDAILQYAIQGKLTEQLPDDGDARDLLKQIQKEKSHLIESGKLKKEKPQPEITEDEIPFDIPDNWAWVRLGNYINFRMGKTPPRHENSYWSKGFPWVSIGDMVDSGVISTTKEQISPKALERIFHDELVPEGTLLMSFKLTIGKVSILGVDSVHNEAIISIESTNNINKYFLLHVLPVISQWGDKKDAIKGKTLNSTSIQNLLLPLPPLAEQKRIVEKLDQILPLCDALE